ncbi:hypothetical protein V3Q90_03290 [Flavobacterium oreochromis]|uniref:hypothetical protein n=1 Tax=Flavobacterium oreochromis TaxID=2906078 RepID=UPI003858CCE9
MKKFVLFFSTIALVFSSCSKGEDVQAENPILDTNSILIKKNIETVPNTISGNHVSTTNYFYIGNKIDKYISTSVNKMGSSTHTYQYTYSGDLITSIVHTIASFPDDNDTRLFTYDVNNRLSIYVQKHLLDGIQYARKKVFTYNTDGTVSEKDYSGNFTTQNTPSAVYYKYYIQNGDVVKKETYSNTDDVLLNTSTYTYDSKNNPFVNIIGYNKIFLADDDVNKGIHNMLTGDTPNSQYLSTFDYNTNNFPTKEYYRDPSNNTVTGTNEFFY